MEAFWGLVGSKVADLLEATQTAVSQGDPVKVLLTGDALSEEETATALRSAVETALDRGAELWLR
jgi:predicted transcriptional regulator